MTDQVIARQEIALQRQRLDDALSGSSAGTWEWHIEARTIVWNERWAEMLGYTLDELKNDITGGATPASFEPAIDYVVTKIPRFAFEKFNAADGTAHFPLFWDNIYEIEERNNKLCQLLTIKNEPAGPKSTW